MNANTVATPQCAVSFNNEMKLNKLHNDMEETKGEALSERSHSEKATESVILITDGPPLRTAGPSKLSAL